MHKTVVIGGGAAGMMAAIASAGNGSKTLLIEKTRNSGKSFYHGKGQMQCDQCL